MPADVDITNDGPTVLKLKEVASSAMIFCVKVVSGVGFEQGASTTVWPSLLKFLKALRKTARVKYDVFTPPAYSVVFGALSSFLASYSDLFAVSFSPSLQWHDMRSTHLFVVQFPDILTLVGRCLVGCCFGAMLQDAVLQFAPTIQMHSAPMCRCQGLPRPSFIEVCGRGHFGVACFEN